MTEATGKIQYYGVYVSERNYTQCSPPFDTEVEADEWGERQKKIHAREGDWAYTFKTDEDGKVIL